MTCPTCGEPIERRGRRGPAPIYCSTRCRKATELARRRWETAQNWADAWEKNARRNDDLATVPGLKHQARRWARSSRETAERIRKQAGERP